MSTDEQQPSTADHEPAQKSRTLAESAAADDVRFLLATFTTLTGKPCSKLMPVEAADELQYVGAGSPGSRRARWVSSRMTPI